jgi:hypothetical protein
MLNPQLENLKAITFLKLRQKTLQNHLESQEIEQITALIFSDISQLSGSETITYLSNLLSELPAMDLPQVLNNIGNGTDNSATLEKIVLFLIKSARPIYQLKALRIIILNRMTTFLPIIYPLIFSSYEEIQGTAIDTICSLRGNSELLLEQSLQDRSPQKRKIAIQVMQKYNPNNLKLTLIQLEDPDFLVRISALQKLGQINDRKWLDRIYPLLSDKDQAVQKTAIETIAILGGRNAKKVLLGKLSTETYPPMRKLIENCLTILK